MLDPRHRNRSRRVRGDSRTIPIRGTGEDSGVWFTCWYCGFTNSKDRNALGGPDSRDGILSVNENLNGTILEGYGEGGYGMGGYGGVTVIMATAPGAEFGEPRSAMALLDGDVVDFMVALKSDSDGNPVPPDVQEPTPYDSQGTGCALCHSTNWRGDF